MISKGYRSHIYRAISKDDCCGFVITEEVCNPRRKNSLIPGWASMTSMVSQSMGTVLYVGQVSHIGREAFIRSTCHDHALVLGHVLGVGCAALSQT